MVGVIIPRLKIQTCVIYCRSVHWIARAACGGQRLPAAVTPSTLHVNRRVIMLPGKGQPPFDGDLWCSIVPWITRSEKNISEPELDCFYYGGRSRDTLDPFYVKTPVSD